MTFSTIYKGVEILALFSGWYSARVNGTHLRADTLSGIKKMIDRNL